MAHELAHLLACAVTGTRVHAFRLFQFGDPAGYVVHDRAASATAGATIALAPFLLNSALGAALAFSAAVKIFAGKSWGWPDGALFWLGFALALHAFPSTADAGGMWQAAKAARFSWLKRLLVAPLVAATHLLSFGARLWLDLAYALAICLGPAAALLATQGRL
jgi:hypothetical protein